ncbi:DUF721 domain-containing protein [Mucilaginibacter roseus]|uniref:DUF721 domain-containing protein n=1 Tax=Mucilaginibacter roseus TaxID=1528868 RepID=A0ABS8U211_9SPHI|nr:DUF721 domain-containing protein [Mucilaginibacter roseus]MCD8741161.1 DUF721 domain-containing protein [Mucilaginibacter roseus]
MRKANDKTLKDAIEQMMQVYKLKRKFNETSVIANWPQLVGTSVANRTKEIYISDKKLFVRIESSVIKHELMLIRNQIIQKINDEAQEVVVEEVVFL